MNLQKYTHIEDSQYRDYFTTDSFLPIVDSRPFKISSLNIIINFDPVTGIADWEKRYLIVKTKKSSTDANDVWWEVTGCPSGEFKKAHDETNRSGFAHETFLDFKDNLIHFINLGKSYELNESFNLITKFEAGNLDKESKILEMDKKVFYKKLLFRNDYASSVTIDKIIWEFNISKGIIKQAWPKTISNVVSDSQVVFEKDNLRPREILTPLVQIEYGSKFISLIVNIGGAFVLGVLTGLAANFIQSIF